MSDPMPTPTPSDPTASGRESKYPARDRTAPGESTVDAPLARSVLFGALALGFRAPVGESLDRLTSGGARGAILSAARLLDAVGAGDEPLFRAAAGLADVRNIDLRRLARRHEQLFGHTARGEVCPFETEYGMKGLFRQPQELADIAGYYRAFGLRTKRATGERVDHVGCECEFLDFLCRKEAYAVETADAAMTAETCNAYRGFFRDHLGRFGRAFAIQMVKADGDDFFGRLGSLLHALVGAEAARLGIPAGRKVLELRSTEADDVPMACGRPEDGNAGPGTDCRGCPE